jgi:hypothetical protein
MKKFTVLSAWHGPCCNSFMRILKKIGRLFVIKNKFEASAITIALCFGAFERGKDYIFKYPGPIGKIMYFVCFVAVLMAGAKMFDAIRLEKELKLRKRLRR